MSSLLSLSRASLASRVQEKRSDFLKSRYRGKPFFAEARDEAAQGRKASHDPLHSLEVGIVGHCYELGVARLPQDGVVGSPEPDYLEGKDFLAVVGGSAETDGKVDASDGSRVLPWHDAMEGGNVTLEPRPVDLQELQGIDVEDVEAATSIHQHLGESGVADDRVDNQWVLPGIQNMVGVVVSIKGDRLSRPVEVPRSGHLH